MTSDHDELRDAVLAVLRDAGADGASLDELLHALGAERREIRAAVRRLSRTGAVTRVARDMWAATAADQPTVGTLIMQQGQPWVASDADANAVSIAFDRLGGAIAGDRVEVVVDFDNGRGVRAGGIARIVEPASRSVSVRLTRSRGLWVGTSPDLDEPVWITEPPRDAARGDHLDVTLDGSRREVKRGGVLPKMALVAAPAGAAAPRITAKAAYARVEGDERNATRLLDQLAAGIGVDLPFTDAARDIANAATAPVDAGDGEDLSDTPLVTIDGETARDFDDAVFAEAIGDELRVVVCVADVASYVPLDSALDAEARERGCSVYLPGRVYPMLPPHLSDDICSLRPHELRRCAWVSMIIAPSGDIEEYDVGFGVLRSHARLTYTQVQAFLDGGALDVSDDVKASLRALDDARTRLHRRRQRRGMLDLDLPEPIIKLTEDGAGVQHVSPHPRLNAHRLIEECMLAANETVADYLESRDLPAIRRVHDDPDFDRVEALRPVAEQLGVRLSFGNEPTIEEIDALISGFDGDPRGRVLSRVVLRAMARAIYAVDDRAHFGIGARRYVHFTSPIRRYPDLEIHRMLRFALDNERPKQAEVARLRSRLEVSAARANTGEDRATRAERFADRLLGARFMADHVGESWPAIVTDVVAFGVFVSVEDPFVDGLVPVAKLGDDFYEYDETLQRFEGRRSGERFHIGDPIRVRCVGVDIGEGRVTFEREFEATDARRGRGRSGGRSSSGRGSKGETPRTRSGPSGSLKKKAPSRPRGPRAGSR